jgi:thiamine-phosphate pyrophosphorylase
VLYELATRAAEITRGSKTRLLVNDRADIARAAGADGVHLTSQSLPAGVVRRTFGSEFLIGVSTHSLDEARAARDGGADFVVFGPVFETESKRGFGAPQGLDKLRQVADELRGFPVLAIGGISLENAGACFDAGASGVAAISLFGGT